jgi:hypothetical protein
MGIAAPGAEGKGTLFVFDPRSRRAELTLPFAWTPVYNSVALGNDGAVWGLANEGIFRFDPQARTLALVARTPQPVTAGFVLMDGALYFASGATIYRYRLPQQPERSPRSYQ